MSSPEFFHLSPMPLWPENKLYFEGSQLSASGFFPYLYVCVCRIPLAKQYVMEMHRFRLFMCDGFIFVQGWKVNLLIQKIESST